MIEVFRHFTVAELELVLVGTFDQTVQDLPCFILISKIQIIISQSHQ